MRIFVGACFYLPGGSVDSLLLPGSVRGVRSLKAHVAGDPLHPGEAGPEPAATVLRGPPESLNATAMARDEVWPFAARNSTDKPKEFGCYWRVPTGCTSQKMGSSWRHDRWAEKSLMRAHERRAFSVIMQNAAACEARKKAWDDYCGSDSVEMYFVPLLKSTEEPWAALKGLKR
ncbi:unnamed protein product [Prorocentrum cordatum]|uniref:Uncharacterized protein n=1 Tax=Prorocentrum cordatum TaxID=2364126 RepID=A0ABN9VA45_9DINO|nr:unnamed protein product [Polarella glacialis]